MEFFEARIQDLQKELAKVRAGEEVHPAAESAFSMELRRSPHTMKLRRKIIEAKYQREIAMYSRLIDGPDMKNRSWSQC